VALIVDSGMLQYSIGKYDRFVRGAIAIPAPDYEGRSKFYLLLLFETARCIVYNRKKGIDTNRK